MKSIVKQLVGALQDLVDNDCTPEPNCSCYVRSPCGDCIEHSATREYIAEANAALKAGNAALGREPDGLIRRGHSTLYYLGELHQVPLDEVIFLYADKVGV